MRIISKKLASYLVTGVLAMGSVSASAATSYSFIGSGEEPTGGKMLAELWTGQEWSGPAIPVPRGMHLMDRMRV